MSIPEKAHNEEVATSVVVSSSVPALVAAEIRADADADDRTPSYIINQILTAHYAKRLAAKAKQARKVAA